MANRFRIALPGYNAINDTNPDHFTLDPNETTNILIKEFARGTIVLAGSGGTKTITHNFGYIPYFMVFTYGTFNVNGNSKTGYLLCSSGGIISVPVYEAYSDTATLNIINNDSAPRTFWYYLFYDNLSSAVANNTIFSKRSIRVALPGKNALISTNPNDFKYHSDFNTLKIINQKSQTINVLAGSNIYTLPHGAKSSTPLFSIFAKFPDGKVTPLSFPSNWSYNNAENGIDSHSIDTTWWDGTNIYIYIASVGTPYVVQLVWIEFEPELE